MDVGQIRRDVDIESNKMHLQRIKEWSVLKYMNKINRSNTNKYIFLHNLNVIIV